MTIEHKLAHFEEVCTRDALAKYEKDISDYTASQESLLAEHMKNEKKQAELKLQAETEKIRRETNKKLSVSQIAMKRAYSQKQDELQGKIFSELRDRLARFMETSQYETMLEAQIRKAKEFAGKEELYVYIDPADEEKKQLLALRTQCDIRVSQYPFLGGTRAVIISKNVLIDNSFETKLKEAGENFQFVLGGKES